MSKREFNEKKIVTLFPIRYIVDISKQMRFTDGKCIVVYFFYVTDGELL